MMCNHNSLLLVGNFLSRSGRNPTTFESLPTRLREIGWEVVVTSHKQARVPRVMDMVITAWQKRNRYEVAHVDVYSGAALLWAEAVTWVLRHAGKPYILTLHGGNLPVFALRWPKRVYRLLNSAQIVATPSRYLQEQMKAYCEGIRLIPYPLEISNYTFQLRQESKPMLIWLRAFCEIYNPTLAPKVVASLKSQFPGIHLIMVGPDKGDGSLQRTRQVAKSLGVQDAIKWTGGVPKDEVPIWLNKGDIFINTTNIDNTPVSVMEAMACGLCVVSTEVGGIPYLLKHEKDGLLVSPNKAEEMASAVARLLNDPDLSKTISSNARKKVEEWDWSVILPKWEELFEELIVDG